MVHMFPTIFKLVAIALSVASTAPAAPVVPGSKELHEQVDVPPRQANSHAAGAHDTGALAKQISVGRQQETETSSSFPSSPVNHPDEAAQVDRARLLASRSRNSQNFHDSYYALQDVESTSPTSNSQKLDESYRAPQYLESSKGVNLKCGPRGSKCAIL
jgi:hypothetical protein